MSRREQPQESSLLPEPVPAPTAQMGGPVAAPVFVEPERKRKKPKAGRPSERDLGTRLIDVPGEDESTSSSSRMLVGAAVFVIILALAAFLLLR